MTMTVGSLFSGIGGFDLGLERAGMEIKWQVEIDKNCQNLLERRFPGVRRYTDVRECGSRNLEPVDLICGGFPCQDLSVAGKREGLAGERSGLWFEFARIIDELEPRWVIIENVPGLLSSDGGQDFAIIIQWLAERGYGVVWRVLDAQYFGLAQRRKRVFIIGSFGNGRSAEVLFEREGMCRDTQKKREAGKVAPSLFASGAGTSRTASAGSESEFCIPFNIQQNDDGRKDRPNGGMYVEKTEKSLTIQTGQGKSRTLISYALNAKGGSGRIDAESETFIPDIARPLANSNTNDHHDESQQTYIAFDANRDGLTNEKNIFPTLKHGGDGKSAHGAYAKLSVTQQTGVRRLTPTECERLQGFPDSWTNGQVDSVRYRQLGNAVAVPVIEWIGKRISMASALREE